MKTQAIASLISALAVVGLATPASASSIIRDPNPPDYHLEIEPHLNLDFLGYYGWGPGVRFSIPLMAPGFVKTINDSAAITFGADLMNGHWGNTWCDAANNCYSGQSYWALYAPVALQWNFFFTEHWSAFGEIGASLNYGFDGCAYSGANDCNVFFRPVGYVGGRYSFNRSISLTSRIGYPTGFSFGVSFFL